MTLTRTRALSVLLFQSLPLPALADPADSVALKVKNPLAAARWTETVSVRLADVKKLLPALDPAKTVLLDATAKPVLSQLVDLDGDETPDELVFQTDFGANQSKMFTLQAGERQRPTRDQFRVYARFVRERHDDFAWENDRIAHRVYGPALEQSKKEPLISSGIDVWVKRTRRLVVNDWYLADNYHQDNGDGADLYSVGKSRGCGGLGVWDGKKLWVSKNFSSSRVLANGPIRLVFELDYSSWDAGGARISETRRVILDAGKSFNRMESRLRVESGKGPLSVGIGIAKHTGASFEVDRASGVLSSWEPLKETRSSLGCAIVLPPGAFTEHQQTELDSLAITQANATDPGVVYYVGSAWDRTGETADALAWKRRAQSFAREIAAPPRVTLSLSAAMVLSSLAVDGKGWATRLADSVMERNPTVLTEKWSYDNGVVLKGFLEVWKKTKDRKYYDYVQRTVAGLVQTDGTIRGYKLEEYNIDQINNGKLLFTLFEHAAADDDRQRYRKALELLRTQLKSHPRTRQGGFWHKKIYPSQMWLDGIYMGTPFLAEYAVRFKEPGLFDEVAHQIVLIEKHTRDPKTGLLYHGWDEVRQQRWANPKTGTSPHFWGRAMGWYAMALVDVLEWMPKSHPNRQRVLGVLERLAAAVATVQDPATGVFWQVLDAGGRGKNYREASATAMFVYALSKAINNGWLDAAKYEKVAARAYQGLVQHFLRVEPNGQVSLVGTCKVAGLGGNPYRDGSFEYYTAGTELEKNDPKGVGALILAAAERAKDAQ